MKRSGYELILLAVGRTDIGRRLTRQIRQGKHRLHLWLRFLKKRMAKRQRFEIGRFVCDKDIKERQHLF